MTNKYEKKISQELNIAVGSVQSVLSLLNEGCTIPFIARYRKEATGSLDEVAIASIRDLAIRLADLDKRRESIISSMKERDLLTSDLEAKINDVQTLAELEDIYLPYKPKRKTRALKAKEKGLEPLASDIFKYKVSDPSVLAESFKDKDKGVETVDDALGGALDIIAEWINEDQNVRKRLRSLWKKYSFIESSVVKGKNDEGEKFKDYFDWSESVFKIPSHRLLALYRGESEGILRLKIRPDFDEALKIVSDAYVRGNCNCSKLIATACEDSYKRLLAPSMESELRSDLKEKADREAISVFARNLKELLMASPLGGKPVLAIDPGFRTGCKIVCLSKLGDLLKHDVIYPLNENGKEKACQTVKKLVEKYEIRAIAIGNGTASRETESLVREIEFDGEKPQIVIVNESGASIYSASKVAREEFPDHDVTVRGAVSIGRRLMDPLAELVKLDPKSIGVGQYQHDVDQGQLQSSLDDTVITCVNSVGVELNTASKELLSYVSGLGGQLAKNIVEFRLENGPFNSRSQLKKVARLGPKAFEQCAGFLRIRNAKNPLDSSGVHPERYKLVQKMAADLNCTVEDLINDEGSREKIDIKRYVGDSVGLPTLEDIMDELEKPGRDPRESLEVFEFKEGVNQISDLKEGMRLPGIITNVTNFGAFVDIGVHQDGLVHISELANRFVKDPTEVVKVQQKVDVLVLKVEEDRKRISLSLKR